MLCGITGRMLRVDLEKGTTTVEALEEEFYRRYFGGSGIISYHLLKEVEKGANPFGPENELIFAAGPLTGSAIPGTGRNSVGAKSPLTGGIGFSEAGGFWGAELKRAGFDAIIIQGSSREPVYLWIGDGKAEIRSAPHLWGRPTAEVEKKIKEERGDPRIRVCQIGVAGEHLIPYASICNDLTHLYGRTGMGAVMGSKKLKAIAVRGPTPTSFADKERVMDLIRWMNQEGKKKVAHRSKLGTAGMLLSLNEMGGLPTRNFRDGQFEGAVKISGETIKETVLVKRETCFGCPIRCKCVVSLDRPYPVDPVYGGPEYETLASLGSLCGIDDLAKICKANEICNANGLDTISAGVCIAFAMECFERGILTEKDTGGVRCEFGNADAMLELLEQIIHRRGLGSLLSMGVKYAAEKIGGEALRYAMHVKGQELPLHEPRLKKGLGLGYMVSPTGADHCHNMHDTAFVTSIEDVKDFGILRPLPADDLGPEKVKLYLQFSNWRHFENCALLCMFLPWRHDQITALVRGVTGWDIGLQESLKIGERVINLARIFNIREGFCAADDGLPERFTEPFITGPLKEVKLTREELKRAKQLFYQMAGWDANGQPTHSKLEELGIEWAESCRGHNR